MKCHGAHGLRLLGLRPAGSSAPTALRPRFALPPGIPRASPSRYALTLHQGPQKGQHRSPRYACVLAMTYTLSSPRDSQRPLTQVTVRQQASRPPPAGGSLAGGCAP